MNYLSVLPQLKPYYTAEEIALALSCHRTSVVRQSTLENWPYEEKILQGGKKRLYPFSSLPATIQIAIQKHYAPAPVPPVTGHLSRPAETFGLPTPGSYTAAEGRLPHHADKIARARADLVAGYLTAKANGKSKKTKERQHH